MYKKIVGSMYVYIGTYNIIYNIMYIIYIMVRKPHDDSNSLLDDLDGCSEILLL